ncbi:hypothetical protein HDC90_000692 [Pedobacter sp. AK013]|uniref:CPBP family intramembrane glutamic endopeptidase n=1 Tax=Pedobacter sp. AK013 TaxID=2723071 RepID=UPI00160C96B1|nr:CPBP family intramembrane glutamic endopeptidase [Pedobacter sp. AK013]MBB6236086.1 hypothetical protein [Pedobacter sp. AK013]
MQNKRIKERAWVRVIQIIIPYILIVGAFQLLANFILGFNVEKNSLDEMTIWQKVILGFANLVGTCVVIWFFRKYIDQKTFKSLGFENICKNDIYLGLITGLLIIMFSFSVLFVFKQIYLVGFNFDFFNIIGSVLFFVFVAFTEEILIRGYVLNNLMISMNKYWALGISAAIFSLMHAANNNYGWFPAVELFISGIFLGLTYIYTKNLIFPIAFHFSWNFFQGTIFGFNVSGNNSYSLINQSRIDNNIWNGGAFGFEGSILSIIVQLVAAILIYLYWNKYRTVFKEVNSK